MTKGITVTVPELIALRRYVRPKPYRPEQRAIRAGNHLSKLRGRGMDFAEVRNYQAGDEIRHMEWRVTARTGKPHIKLYQEERERPAIILTDFNPSMYFGTRVAFKSVIAAELSALIAWTAASQGDRVGGLVVSGETHQEFAPRAREIGVLPFLAALSEFSERANDKKNEFPQASSPLSHLLLRLRRVARPGSVLVLISDFYHLDKDSEQHLSRLRAHNDILVYHVCDPLELHPPKPQQYAMTDGQATMLLDTNLKHVFSAYATYCEERIANVQRVMNRLQIQYVQVAGDQDLPRLVQQTYPQRSR